MRETTQMNRDINLINVSDEFVIAIIYKGNINIKTVCVMHKLYCAMLIICVLYVHLQTYRHSAL